MPEITMRQFVNSHAIRISSELTDHNPHMADMPRGSAHWKVTLKCGRRQITLYFSQGPAIVGEPRVEEVLSCLASDALSVEEPFEEWCISLGFDPDSRKAEKTYKVCEEQARKLRQLLYTEEAYDQLLYHTERL